MSAIPTHDDGIFYSDLAPWWPLISPVEDYREEAAFVAQVLRSAPRPVRRVLELGSGGGHNAFYLKQHFELTLTDLSNDMLAVSRRLNPECRHLQGDMRTLRLGERFDAVFVHDAIDYMTSEQDLGAVMATAFAHLEPGGSAVFIPDQTRETYETGSDCDAHDADDGRGVAYLEWNWDPDPNDDWMVTEYAFVLREADGTVRSVHESHRYGVFAQSTWVRLLEAQGFIVRVVQEETSEDRTPRAIFVGQRPA